MRVALACALLVCAVAGAFPACAEIIRFSARLTGAAEVPPLAGRGSGRADLVLDTDTKMLSWRVSYSGLTGPVTAAHFRTPAEPGSALTTTMDFKGPFATPIVSSTRLNDIEIGDLRAGLWSLNLMTAAHPKGEIGGDLESQP